MPQLLFDLAALDLSRVVMGVPEIEGLNPHRGLMRLLDGVLHIDPDGDRGVAFKDVRADEFWVPGHIPGRPLFPGVLMIEIAAQLASLMRQVRAKDGKFMGFVGVEEVRFRGQVVPGDRLVMAGKAFEYKPRRTICDCQGFVGGTPVFEARVIGMPI
jgi:3-hydroxyacyl-[acyl-carrier-protein] dehydratase